jgi:membrane protein
MPLLAGDPIPHVPQSSRSNTDRERAASTSIALRSSTAFKISVNIVMRIGRDNLMLVAAGVAFYAMTAVFPAIAAFVSIYGLFGDPNNLAIQIEEYSSLLPADSFKLLTDALKNFANKSNSSLSAALLISVVVALWSAKAGVSSLMTGLNIANETTEKRSFFVQQATAFMLNLGAILFAAVALGAIALLPALMSLAPHGSLSALGLVRWPILAVLICLALAVLYRFGPCREKAKWRWITLGSAVACVFWLAGSGAFSFYVSRFGSYDKTYGSLAAPVVLLLWFWLSALIVLIGAEVDAEMEHADGKEARSLPAGAP